MALSVSDASAAVGSDSHATNCREREVDAGAAADASAEGRRVSVRGGASYRMTG